MGLRAFTLTDQYAGTQEDGETPIFGGGQIAKMDGTTFDLAVALEDGEGTIVVDDMDPLCEQLTILDAFEEVAAPAAPEPEQGDYLDGLNLKQLKAEADERGIPNSGTKAEVADRIREHDDEANEADAVDPDATTSSDGDDD
jgi:hypothetical protein